MKMSVVALLLLTLSIPLTVFADPSANLEPIPSYYSHTDFMPSTPGAAGSALGGFVNPAIYGLLPGYENQFLWSDRGAKFRSMDRWGWFFGLPHVGFGLVHQRQNVPDESGQVHKVSITDYRLAVAGGEEAFCIGIGYGWSGGEFLEYPRDHLFQAGMVSRPVRQLSVGLCGDFATKNSRRRGLFDLALRPLGTPWVTLFGDVELYGRERLEDARWGVGAVLEPLPGIELSGKYRDDETFTLGMSVSFGRTTISARPHYGGGGGLSYTTYGIRGGYPRANVFDRYFKKKSRYLSLPLKGRVTYRKYRYFDEKTHTLSDILAALDGAIDDPRVAGVAVNLSGTSIPGELAWEVRHKLGEVREAGKKVIVFIDRGEMREYHLASVADRVVMDPEGFLFIPGYLAGMTFYRGTLEKLGLGVDILRFYKYKSAGEMFSRDDMSAADREQRQALIDDRYELVRGEISASRGIAAQRFDEWIDQGYLFNAQDAAEQGLVDTLGRWIDVDDFVKAMETGRKKKLVGPGGMAVREFPSPTWGPKPGIAVVYGLGFCAMDWGIKARQLEKVFQRLEKDGSVKAVVFRVDSPGGTGMASDVVAAALKKCAARKPVIVSQGSVAASGGYHISMYADTIVASPRTVTGSIGVLGGWLWNKGLGSGLGMTTDHVKVGDHADMAFGVWLPLLGLQLPDRQLSPEERARFERVIREGYRTFVAQVAQGRGMTTEQVEAAAQGRVWSGIDGQKVGLVDEIGGLDRAIQIARTAAGIGPEEEFEIVELPGKGLFKLDLGGPGVLALDLESEPTWQYLKLFSEHPGGPLQVLPPELFLE
jgi:protease-4